MVLLPVLLVLTGAFSDSERAAVAAYWSAPGRYRVEPADDKPVVRLTAEASLWYLKYDRARKAQTAQRGVEWESAVARRQAYDRTAAQVGAAEGSAPLPDDLI